MRLRKLYAMQCNAIYEYDYNSDLESHRDTFIGLLQLFVERPRTNGAVTWCLHVFVEQPMFLFGFDLRMCLLESI